jgi:hypothetical protein
MDKEDAKVNSNAETFVDGISRHVVKDAKEAWTRPMTIYDYNKVVLGRWKGGLDTGTIEGWEKKTMMYTRCRNSTGKKNNYSLSGG